MDPAVATLAGVALGGLLTGALTVLQSWLDRRHARAARSDDRQHARDVHQADTLLEVQYGLQRLASAGMSCRDLMLTHWEQTGEWEPSLPPGHYLREEVYVVGVAIRALVARLTDEGVRELALHINTVAARTDGSPEEAHGAIERLLESYIHIQPMIADRLRLLPPPSTYQRLIDSLVRPLALEEPTSPH